MKDFQQLKVWEKAHNLVLDIYKTTAEFPLQEQYAQTGQVQRTAVSIPTDFGEECGKATHTDFKHFLQIAMGPSSKLEYLFMRAKDPGYLSAENHQTLGTELIETSKMLNTLTHRPEAKS